MTGGTNNSLATYSVDEDTFDLYDEVFKFKDSLSSIEFGGLLDCYKVFFAVEDTEKNRKELDRIFTGDGISWKDKFNLLEGEHKTSDGTTIVNKYYIKYEYGKKLNSAQAKFLASNLDVYSDSHSTSCWKRTLEQIAVMAIAVYTGNPWVMASAFISSAYYFSGRPMPKDLAIALAVITLGEGVANSGWTVANVASVANLGIGYVNNQKSIQELQKIHEVQRKTKENRESYYEAKEFESHLRYIYEDSFNTCWRGNLEKSPYYDIQMLYSDYASYPWVTTNIWDQDE